MDRLRYVIAGLIGFGLIVLIFVLIFRGFTGGGKSATPAPTPKALTSYASTDAAAQLTIDGPIVADSAHRSVIITVTQFQTQLDVIQGYQGSVIASQTFANNQDSYRTFLKALDLQGFTKGTATSTNSDPTGTCPQGNRYTYALNQFGAPIVKFWANGCGGGNFSGNRPLVRWLFQQQIPQDTLFKLTSGISLGS